MPAPTPRQLRTRARFETVIGLASPILDLVLATGERVARITGSEDDYIPIRTASDRLELGPASSPGPTPESD